MRPENVDNFSDTKALGGKAPQQTYPNWEVGISNIYSLVLPYNPFSCLFVNPGILICFVLTDKSIAQNICFVIRVIFTFSCIFYCFLLFFYNI